MNERIEKPDSRAPAGGCGKRRSIAFRTLATLRAATSWVERYEELLLSHFPKGEWLRGMRIVVDCANGAMSVVAPAVLRALGADVHVICANPTGKNINANCGAVHPETLVAAMKDGRRPISEWRSMVTAIVLCLYRVVAELVDGDARAAGDGAAYEAFGSGWNIHDELCARADAAKRRASRLTRVAVGDRYIFEEMQRSGALLGGEPSGHIIFSDFRLSGDGLLTTLKLAQAMVETGQVAG